MRLVCLTPPTWTLSLAHFMLACRCCWQGNQGFLTFSAHPQMEFPGARSQELGKWGSARCATTRKIQTRYTTFAIFRDSPEPEFPPFRPPAPPSPPVSSRSRIWSSRTVRSLRALNTCKSASTECMQVCRTGYMQVCRTE